MSGLPWFRMYSEAIDDDKLRLLAFEDRWHFTAILCCKAQGILDTHPETLDRRVAVKLGLDLRAADEVRRRLLEVNLIDENWQPTAWDKRQFKSDQDPTATERKRRQRQRERTQNQQNNDKSQHVTRESHVTDTDVTRTDTDTDTEEDTDEEIETNVSMPDFAAQSADPPAAESKNGKIPWDKDTYIGKASRVLDLLNRKLGTKYPATTGAGKPTACAKLIIDRLKDGYGADDFKAVISDRLHAWQTDDKMREYLRPQTLFRASNFEQYLGQAKRESRR